MCLIISRYLICFTLWNSNQIIILLWFFLSFSFISVNFGRHMKSMWFFFVGFVIRCNEEVLIQQPKWNVCLVLAISQTIEFHCFESNYDQLSWQNCVGELIERSKKKKTLTNLICRSCQMLIAIESISNESNLLQWNIDIRHSVNQTHSKFIPTIPISYLFLSIFLFRLSTIEIIIWCWIWSMLTG